MMVYSCTSLPRANVKCYGSFKPVANSYFGVMFFIYMMYTGISYLELYHRENESVYSLNEARLLVGNYLLVIKSCSKVWKGVLT